MKAFEGMGLAEIKRYHKVVEDAAHDYLQACSSFMTDPGIQTWKSYTRAYPALYAALWISFFWRMYIKEKSSSMANHAGVSTFIYEQMLTNTQSRLTNYEEDTKFRKNICGMA